MSKPEELKTPSDVAHALARYYPGAQDAETLGAFEAIRDGARHMIHAILNRCPPGPDRTTAVQHVRDAMQRAIASIVVPQEAVLAIASLGR